MIKKYAFKCYEDKKGCGQTFLVECERSDIDNLHPKCPSCKKIRSIGRCYQAENHTFFGPTVTIGSRIDKNNSLLSDDFVENKRKKTLGKKDEL